MSELFGQEVFESILQPRLDRCPAGEVVQFEHWFNFPVVGRRCIDVVYTPCIDSSGLVEAPRRSSQWCTMCRYSSCLNG